MDITAMGKDEAGVEDVIDQIKRVIVSDGDGDADSMFSIEVRTLGIQLKGTNTP